MAKPSGTTARDLLLADDEPRFRNAAATYFSRNGYRVEEAGGGEDALQLAGQRRFDATLLIMANFTTCGFDLLPRLKSDSGGEVILLSGQATIEAAVAAMKLGAYDFLTKPVRWAQLNDVVDRACRASQFRKEIRQGRAVAQRSRATADMIGESEAMQEVFRLILRAGPTDTPILIQGETGTGKELVARALHQTSPRADKPMVVINCAALPELLLESELFGHEKGSFTGATSAKPGLFETADGGTLFIDEIGEMAGCLQAKLLRVLEDGSFRRVGALAERRVDVRLLTATNRDLGGEVRHRRFREDLYYRINVMRLQLPPLRDRRDDIPLLAHHFAGGDWIVGAEAMRAFYRFNWPGNVRQLINAIDRAKILADDRTILFENLPSDVAGCVSSPDEPPKVDPFALEATMRRHVQTVMEHEHGNKSRAAQALGVSRRSLYRLLDKYEIGDHDAQRRH